MRHAPRRLLRRPLAALSLTLALSLAVATSACRATDAPAPTIEQLRAEEDVDAAGKRLMRLPPGLTRLDGAQLERAAAVVAIHGHGSRGKEWIDPLARFAESDVAVYFYRWNFNSCPETALPKLREAIEGLRRDAPGIKRLILVGHSYGGVLATRLAQELAPGIDMEVHIIASPLASVPALERVCGFEGVPASPPKAESTAWRQWRTVKEQDGAFKDLDSDPQEVTLPQLTVTQLPGTLESGERLGHNRSISWVADQLHPLTPAGDGR